MRCLIDFNRNDIFTKSAKVLTQLHIHAIPQVVGYHDRIFKVLVDYNQKHGNIVKSVIGAIDERMRHDKMQLFLCNVETMMSTWRKSPKHEQ